MPRVEYESWQPRGATLALVVHANRIIEEYAVQGFELTLRQLYYQFVSRALLPNQQQAYKRLGDVVSRARRAGLLDWDAIVDRTRELKRFSTWNEPAEIVAACAEQFRLDAWADQPCYVEVWFEKDALAGVFERPCEELRVPYFSCRGYTSDSEVWRAARRFRRHREQECVVLHFGDHDPSGIDMTRDIGDRLTLFGASVEVRRVALTMEQIQEHEPPPNPAKETDARFAGYQAEFGDESWELDALNPTILAQLVNEQVGELLDSTRFDAVLNEESIKRTTLRRASERWPQVETFVNRRQGR